MLDIRPFEPTPENFIFSTYLHNLTWPEWPKTAEQSEHDYNLFRKDKWRAHFFAYRDGRPVIKGGLEDGYWLADPAPAFLFAYEEPSVTEAEFAEFVTFLERIAAERNFPFTQVEQLDNGRRHSFWERRGYSCSLVGPVSRLDVQSVDFAPFADAERRFADQGLKIVSLAELEATGEDWRPKFHALRELLLDDVPHSGPREPQTFERFCELYPSEEYFPRETTWFALDGDQLIAITGGAVGKANPRSFDTHLTGTLREHRRRGIATAMKLHAIRWCQANGITTIDTGNEKDNPMYQLNVALGFRQFCAWMVMDNHNYRALAATG